MRRRLACGALLLFAASLCLQGAGNNIVLKLAWAKEFRNRLSIDATVTVLALNAGKEADGDRHGGSSDNAVGLPMVAEILNGALPPQQPGIHALEPGSNPQKHVYGAWRLWVEHPPAGGGTQCQTFSGTPPAICAHEASAGADSNPAHSFEIHPVFAVDGVPVARGSMVLTSENQSVKDVDDAFKEYTGSKKILVVARSNTALTLTSIIIRDNYVRLHLRVTKVKVNTTRQQDGKVDGGYVIADVLSGSQVLKSGLRIFYFRDSDPGDVLDKAQPGTELDILGMPRISLDAVLTATDAQSVVSIPIPFEFIALAIPKT